MTIQSHLAAINLARRWSIQNEPDMLQVRDGRTGKQELEKQSRMSSLTDLIVRLKQQENIMEDPMNIGHGHVTYDHSTCQQLASRLSHYRSLPEECKSYTDVATELKRRDSDNAHPTQYLS